MAKSHHDTTRLVQSTLPFVNTATMKDEEEDECDIPLRNEEVHAKLYGYCVWKTGADTTLPLTTAETCPTFDPSRYVVVYVGQTIQELRERDRQHLSGSDTSFDRQYTNRAQFVLVLLRDRRFAPATRDGDFKDDTLDPACAWMDHWEPTLIAEHDTYHNGLNSTRGGQGRGWLVAMRESKAKKMYARFKDVYMPAFREFHAEHGHVTVPWWHNVLGNLMYSIRSGNTQIPPSFEEELLSLGFDIMRKHRDVTWTDTYMPAFLAFRAEHGHLNVPQRYPVIGSLVKCIRQGSTQIPPSFEEELLSLGFDMGNIRDEQRDERWICTYIPKLRIFHAEHGHVNVPRDRENKLIGDLVHGIRTGGTQIPSPFKEELVCMGFFRHTKNVAVQVAWLLDRPIESLEADPDPVVKETLVQVSKVHSNLLTLRHNVQHTKGTLVGSGLFQIPFGTMPLGDGMTRYAADLRNIDDDVLLSRRNRKRPRK